MPPFEIPALLILLLGLALGLSHLVFSMYALLGTLLVSRFLSRKWIEAVRAERRCAQTSAQIGETVTVKVRIRNASGWPIVWLLVEEMVPARAIQQRPPRLKVEGRRMAVLQLGAYGARTLEYKVRCLQRGYYHFGPLLCETGDLFGLQRRYRLAAGPAFLLVYPKVLPLLAYDLASRRPVGEIRLQHRLFEDPTRISGIRAYQPGDPLQRVHWRATARTGALQSKQYEASCVAGVTVILDFHQAGYHGAGALHASELAVTAAASLAHAVTLLGQPVGLATNGRDAADRYRAEGIHHERLGQVLAGIGDQDNEAFSAPPAADGTGGLRMSVEFATRDEARAEAERERASDRLQPILHEARRGPEPFESILRTLARVELTDGLRLEELIREALPRLARDTTLAVIVPGVTPEGALALGMLRRAGFSVTVLLLALDDFEHHQHAGRLLEQRIDFRRVQSEEDLVHACGEAAVGGFGLRIA